MHFVLEGFRYNLWTKLTMHVLYKLILMLSQTLRITGDLKDLHCSWPSQACHRVLMWSLHIELGQPAYLHGPIVLLNALYGNK